MEAPIQKRKRGRPPKVKSEIPAQPKKRGRRKKNDLSKSTTIQFDADVFELMLEDAQHSRGVGPLVRQILREHYQNRLNSTVE